MSACIISRFGLRWRFGSSPASMDCAPGAGSAANVVPSITLPPWALASNDASRCWIMASSASSLRFLIALLCSSVSWRGIINVYILQNAAGCSFATRSNAFAPCFCQAIAMSCRKALFTTRRTASGDPPAFPEYPGANLPLMRPLMTGGTVSRLRLACIVFAWF